MKRIILISLVFITLLSLQSPTILRYPFYNITDTTSSSPYGSELLTNGTFDSDLSGWIPGSYWTWESDGGGGGRARHSTGLGSIYQDILTPTTTYHIVFTIGGMTTGSIVARPGNNPGTTRTSNGTYEEDIVCGGDSYMRFTPSSDFDGYIDDCSCKEVL